METKKRILIIGEVYIDHHMDKQLERLGGIFHSARMLSALKKEFALAAILPAYLSSDYEQFSKKLNATTAIQIGETKRSPNIMNIFDSKEAGPKHHENILQNQAEVELDLEGLDEQINTFMPTDILLYPGNYDCKSILSVVLKYGDSLKVHIDLEDSATLDELLAFDRKIETIFLSTSSPLFREEGGTLGNLIDSSVAKVASFILLKENRGGSTLINTGTRKLTEVPAFLTLNEHSIGIGDCYNAAYISLQDTYVVEESMKIASFYSSEYAATYDYEVFKRSIECTPATEIIKLAGIRLPWDTRKTKHIYIAGPDFPIMDRTYFEKVDIALNYHNFSPHRPIIENGVYTGEEDYHIQQNIYNEDVRLMEISELMVVVLLNDDPGTLVEIGWMNKKGKPIILFDPFHIVHNLFLKKSVTCIVHSLDEVIYHVFRLLGSTALK